MRLHLRRVRAARAAIAGMFAVTVFAGPGQTVDASALDGATAKEQQAMEAGQAGNFNITLRMYWPKDKAPSINDGTWVPPAVNSISH